LPYERESAVDGGDLEKTARRLFAKLVISGSAPSSFRRLGFDGPSQIAYFEAEVPSLSVLKDQNQWKELRWAQSEERAIVGLDAEPIANLLRQRFSSDPSRLAALEIAPQPIVQPFNRVSNPSTECPALVSTVVELRERVNALAATLREAGSDLSKGSDDPSGRPLLSLVPKSRSLSPDVAQLFWICVGLDLPDKSKRWIKALVDPGSQLTIIDESLAQSLGLLKMKLEINRPIRGAVGSQSKTLSEYVVSTLTIGDLGVAGQLRMEQHPFFVMETSITLLLGKLWLEQLESISITGRAHVDWTHGVCCLVTPNGKSFALPQQ
jgi:hypothetical protein